MNGSEERLLRQRMAAAAASGGYSFNVIYDAVTRLAVELRLRGRALDFGAGVGNFTLRLHKLGLFDVIAGLDIMRRPNGLPHEIAWIERDLNDEIPTTQYDTIFAIETIEHLENPHQVVRDLYRMLAPGGAAIITTPNNESWRSLVALLMRGHYVAFGDSNYPAHITALVRKDLERMCVKVGFGRPNFRFSNHGGLPGMPTITWQQISGGLLSGARYSDNVICIATKPG